MTSGVNGTDYTLDDKGNPVLTKQGNSDANYTPWKYVTQHPAVIYTPDIPNYAKTLSDAEHALIPYGVSDPTVGLISPTQITKGAAMAQPVTDGTTDIIVGQPADLGLGRPGARLLCGWRRADSSGVHAGRPGVALV